MQRFSLVTAGAAAALLGACASVPRVADGGAGPASSGVDSFNANSLSRYAAYSDAGGGWTIEKGALVGRGPAIQSVLIRNGVSASDAWVEAASSHADDGGLVLRFVDPSNYYLLTFRDDAAPSPRGMQNLALYHHVGTAYHELWRADISWPRGTTHSVRFQAEGSTLLVFFDGMRQVSLTPTPRGNDPSPSTRPGGLGVRHYGADADWMTTFKHFRWQAGDHGAPPR